MDDRTGAWVGCSLDRSDRGGSALNPAWLVWLAAPAGAGTWVREPGHGYAQLGVGVTVAQARFTEQGRRLDLRDPHFVPDNFEQVFDDARFTQLELAAYAEVGIAGPVELFGALPVRQLTSRWDFRVGGDVLRLQNRAFGDAMLGLRAGGDLGRSVGAVHAAVRLPLYDNAPEVLGIEAGNADIYDDRPPVGQGTVDVDLGASVGTSGAAWWVQGEASVRLRNRQFGALLPLRAQVGARPLGAVGGFGVFAEVEALLPLVDGQAPDVYLDAFNKGPLALDRVSFLRPGLGVLWEASGSGGAVPGVLGRVDAVVLGRRTAATVTGSLAATLTW